MLFVANILLWSITDRIWEIPVLTRLLCRNLALMALLCGPCMFTSARAQAPLQLLSAGTGTNECNQHLERCVIPVYVFPPNVSSDGSPASQLCSTWLEHRKTFAGGATKRIVWVLVEAILNDTAIYRFVNVRNAIQLVDESAFDEPDVEDSGNRKRFKWKVRPHVPGQTNYSVLIEASTDGGRTFSPCDKNDPIVVNEG